MYHVRGETFDRNGNWSEAIYRAIFPCFMPSFRRITPADQKMRCAFLVCDSIAQKHRCVKGKIALFEDFVSFADIRRNAGRQIRLYSIKTAFCRKVPLVA